jgi:hypothetical protein
VIAYTCKYWNISVVFIEIFQHNQQYDTLLPIIPCRHKLKAGIAYCSFEKLAKIIYFIVLLFFILIVNQSQTLQGLILHYNLFVHFVVLGWCCYIYDIHNRTANCICWNWPNLYWSKKFECESCCTRITKGLINTLHYLQYLPSYYLMFSYL